MSGVKNKGGRQPADQPGAGRQEVWLAIKGMPSAFAVGDLVKETGLNRNTVARYLKALAAAGYLEKTPAPNGRASIWKLVNDIGHHAPRVREDGSAVTLGAVTTQLWRAMMMLKEFDYTDLIHHSSIEIPEATSKDYCKRLLAAGYLRVISKADPLAARIARYRLIRATGPKAPQVQRVRQVYDPNTRVAHPVAGGAK